MSTFDVTSKLFSRDTFRNSNINDKIDLYFQDFSMIPLMVQQNYINMQPAFLAESGLTGKQYKAKQAELFFQAADSISRANLVESLAQRESSWSMMPLHAVLSTVTPCFYTHGNMSGMFAFAGWLGQNSKATKSKRILKEVQTHMALRTSASEDEVRLHYLPLLSKMLTAPLVKDISGVEEVIRLMDEYYLTRDDWDSIADLGYQSLITDIPSKTKATFTRSYNKVSHKNPFNTDFATKKRASASEEQGPLPDSEEVVDVDTIDDAEPEEEEVVIAPKKKAAAKKAPAKKPRKTTK